MTERQTFRTLALLLMALSVSSCFRGTLPARDYYRLAPLCRPSALAGNAGNPREGTLAVYPYSAPGIYGDQRIVYRSGNTEYNSYPNREWALPLGEMLGLVTLEVLREVPVTDAGAVYDPPSRRAQRYVWRGAVRRFEEVNRGRDVLVGVQIDVQLLIAATDSIIWTGSENIERAIPEPTMEAIIEGLSLAACEVIERLALSARAAAAADAARPANIPPVP